MKNAIKLLSLLIALGLVTGCGVKTPSSEQKSDDVSENTSQKSNEESSDSEGEESSDPDVHTHSWQSNWTSDPDYHWHKCDGCSEIKDKAAHTWDGGKVTKEAGPYETGIKTFTCSACNRTRTEEIPATGGGEQEGSFVFDDDALEAPREIHTVNQKKYLNLGIQYYHITASDLSSCSASGTSNVSAPNKVTVSWNYTAPSGKSVSKFQLLYGQRSDLGDAYTIDGTTANSVSFYNPYLGDNYFKVVANLSDGTKEASPIKVFKVDTQAPRNIYAGNLPNVRDMGGRTTYAGGKIKQGLIYRGAGHNFDQRGTSVSSEGKSIITNQLRVKTEINVANGTGNNLNLTGVTVKNAFMDYGQESTVSGISERVGLPYSNLSRNAEKIRQVMDILADETNYPVFYHCRIGTDRTGITGMMIGGLLGIPFNEIFQDYCFSNFAPIDGQRYPNKASDKNGDDPAKYIDEILAMPGKNFQEQTYNALLTIGCPAETLNTVIDIMTEGNKAELPTTAKIAKGNALTSTGSKKSGSDYNDPDTYYQLSSGKEASMTADLTAGQKDIVVYLGSTDSSNTTQFANCIELKIDGETQTISNTKTMFTAGFGTTAQNHRTAYMFNMLGKFDLSAGSHNVTISVKSGTFNLATICVFDHVEPTA